MITKRIVKWWIAGVLLVAGGMQDVVAQQRRAVAAPTGITGVITQTDGKRQSGVLKWSLRDKAYVVQKVGGTVELQVPFDDVESLSVPEPRTYAQAMALVNSGKDAEAIPILEKIAADYTMLQWDRPAIRALAGAYMNAKRAEKALEACEKIIAMDASAAYKGEMAPAYWQALLALGRKSVLNSAIERAISSGDRYSSGAAMIMRGDMVLAEGETADNARKALTDGYLRVIMLYKDVADIQPEALYKAAKCFDKLQQGGRAERCRTDLKKSFASSSWAGKQ